MDDEDWLAHPRTQALLKWLRQRQASATKALVSGALTLDLNTIRVLGHEIVTLDLLLEQFRERARKKE